MRSGWGAQNAVAVFFFAKDMSDLLYKGVFFLLSSMVSYVPSSEPATMFVFRILSKKTGELKEVMLPVLSNILRQTLGAVYAL